MLDLHAPALLSGQGERLSREEYKREFRRRDAEIRNAASWKLERRQHFEEQGVASRDALRRGDWEEALRLIDAHRDVVKAAAAEDARNGNVFHRVRVVERPLTPYLQWELHTLRLQAEFGQRVRVVSAESVAPLEETEPLPEVVALGGRTLYRVMYSASGQTEGAIRFTDPGLVAEWGRFIETLFAPGEEIASYFEREVAHLPPPATRVPE